MADDMPIDPAIEKALDKETGPVAGKAVAVKQEPSYRMLTSAKIPIAKVHGKIWKSRRDQAKKAMEDVQEAWGEAVRYHGNDQMEHRDVRPGEAGNIKHKRRQSEKWSETENIVFANVCAMIPALYSKNPEVEATRFDETVDAPDVVPLERLINALFRNKTAPGVNMKPKAHKAVVWAFLTNTAWARIGWTPKADSNEQAIEDLQKLGKELASATKIPQILEIEGKLQAIEEQVNILTPEGPWVRVINPNNMLIDPETESEDLSDCRWMMEADFLPTDYIKAKYASQDEDSEQYKSIYEPTHVLKLGKSGTEGHDEGDFFKLDPTKGAEHYGYDKDGTAFDRAKTTQVWWIWDKTTRRLYLYHGKDWTWPLWVWDDPLKLDQFFPYYKLSFLVDPEHVISKGEVTYYLDQQDAINEINSEQARARQWARRKMFYNTDVISPQMFEEFMTNDKDGIGVKLPEGSKINDHIYSAVPPSVQWAELFATEGKLAAIDRLSSVSDVLRGAQFKTNTTNGAIQNYTASTNLRVDARVDQIEDWLSNIAWGLAQLCLMNMKSEMVAQLIGPTQSAQWTNLQPQEIKQMFLGFGIVAGSTTKPTSQFKKEEAVKLGQVLGQFASGSPAVVLVMLRVLERAFDEVVIKHEDWEMIIQSVQQAMMPPAAAEGAPPAEGGEAKAGAGDAEMEAALQQLPPELQQVVQELVGKGVPVARAIDTVVNGGQ